MAHPAQQAFCQRVKALFPPKRFTKKRVLDCGSLDINGSNRTLFTNCAYVGVDIGPGKNVDIVCPVHELDLPDESFDVIVSTECFEHDRHYEKSLQTIVRLLAKQGLFFFSCAGETRPEHGTRQNHPASSPLTAAIDGWGDYYKNLTEKDIRTAIDVADLFSSHEFSRSKNLDDLYFWGIKF